MNKLNYWYTEYTDEAINKIAEASETAANTVKENYGVISDKATQQHDEALGSDVAQVQQIDKMVDDEQIDTNDEAIEDENNVNSDDLHQSESNQNIEDVQLRYSFVSPNENAVLGNDKLRNMLIFKNVMEVLNRSCSKNGNTVVECNEDEDNENDYEESDENNNNCVTPMTQCVDDDSNSYTNESTEIESESNVSSSLPTFGNSDGSTDNQQTARRCYRLNQPINEFQASDFILGSAFPHVFLFGYAYAKKCVI